MKQIILLLFILVSLNAVSQGVPRQGDHAPSFIVTLEKNSIQSYVFPYMKRIVLLHFWSSDVITSKIYGKHLNHLARRYKNVIYKNADNFEVIAIAVQSNKKAWHDAIAADSLNEFTHAIASKGYDDDACKKYGIISLPTDIIIDEAGTIIAVDPKLTEVENLLDERKNFQPVKKDVTGILAQSSDKAEVLKFSKLYLFNHYGDSVGKTFTTGTGRFSFSDIKLNQDFILKVDNQSDIVTSDPIALYTPNGTLLMKGVTSEGGFVFNIPARLSTRLTETENSGAAAQLNVIKNLEFAANGNGLSAKDEKELTSIASQLENNDKSRLEFTANTDSKLDDAAAFSLTERQVKTLMVYFEKKGIASARIKGTAKGNSEPRIICDRSHVCTEEEHKENRRVEFFIHKN